MKLASITPILNVSDVPASIARFLKLGWRRGFTWNDGGILYQGADANEHGQAQFGSACSGKSEIFLCKDALGLRGGPAQRHLSGDDDTGGVWMSWWLRTRADVDAHDLAVQNGMTIAYPPTDEPWGCREFQLVHSDGHTFRIAAAWMAEL